MHRAKIQCILLCVQYLPQEYHLLCYEGLHFEVLVSELLQNASENKEKNCLTGNVANALYKLWTCCQCTVVPVVEMLLMLHCTSCGNAANTLFYKLCTCC